MWKAYDAKLQRTVAIKVLHDTADAASRILAEARAASALNHPHVCTIHDVGDAAPSTPSTGSGQADWGQALSAGSGQAVSFIVMEYVEGKPLNEVIPADGLPPGSVIRYGTQIADALAHAHALGIVGDNELLAMVAVSPELLARARHIEWWSFWIAECYAFIGEETLAVDWLENAFERGFMNYRYLSRHSPVFRKLDRNPAFQELLGWIKTRSEQFEP